MKTSPLGTVLRDLADAADAWRLPPPDAVRTRGDRRRRRTALRAAALGVLVCVVLVLVLATLGTPDRASQPADTVPVPTGPTGTPPSSGPDLTSPRHPIASGGHRFRGHAIAAHGGRFVVVGDSSDLVDPGPPVYWSDNGVDWHAPAGGSGPVSVNVTDVIATDDGFLAVGVDRNGVGAWRSADGRTWVEAPVTTTGAGGEADGLWGVTETSLGFYAWGFVGGRAHLWRSPDGTAWSPVGDEAVFDLPRREAICAVRDVEGGLRATGVVAPPGTLDAHRVAWTSADGETWVLQEAAGSSTYWCDPTAELGHWEARSDAGLVRIQPNGRGGVVELVP